MACDSRSGWTTCMLSALPLRLLSTQASLELLELSAEHATLARQDLHYILRVVKRNGNYMQYNLLLPVQGHEEAGQHPVFSRGETICAADTYSPVSPPPGALVSTHGHPV